MVDTKHFQGYSNWASWSFSVVWSNDEAMYNDFVEYAAGFWIQEDFGNDLAACGEAIVTHARDHYTGSGDGHMGHNFFPDLETDDEWDEIDREGVGEEIRDAITAHGRYAHLLEA